MGGSSASARAVELGQLGQRRDLSAEFAQGGDGMVFQRAAQAGQLLERDAQGDQVARVAAALDEPGDEPLDVAHLAQALLQQRRARADSACAQATTLWRRSMAGRSRSGASSHWRRRRPPPEVTVRSTAERSVVWRRRRCAKRIDQLEIAARGGIEDEHVLALPEAQGVDMAERPAQFVAEVMEQPARRAERAAEEPSLPATVKPKPSSDAVLKWSRRVCSAASGEKLHASCSTSR